VDYSGHRAKFCDPVIRESSDPETQLTRWPCSIMNSKCRLMLQTNVCNGQEVCQVNRCLAFARFWKVKFWRSFIKCQYFNDGWTDFHKKIYIFILGFFSKTGKKTQVSHRIKMTTRWKMTHWPGDPMTQFHVWCVTEAAPILVAIAITTMLHSLVYNISLLLSVLFCSLGVLNPSVPQTHTHTHTSKSILTLALSYDNRKIVVRYFVNRASVERL